MSMHNTSWRSFAPLLLLSLLVFLASCSNPISTNNPPTQPEKIASIHLELGYPLDADTTDDYLLLRPQYALSYNRKRNEPNWVSWNLNRHWYGDAPRYSGNFIADPLLPEWFYHPKHDDYTNSGYDRGHMVRSEERTKNDEDNKSTFYMSNIIPQRPDLNRGVWLDLEYYCEALCKDSLKQLFVIAGPVFTDPIKKTIGNGIAIPDSCFKIIVVLDDNNLLASVSAQTRVIAVVMPNIDGVRKDDWTQYTRTVDHIEAITGYDFLNYVSPAIQAAIEAQ